MTADPTSTPTPIPAPRAERLEKLAHYLFDVLVIGGGVTGAATARDAAMRGMRVALVEKDDFGAGTSSRSSRLIHGGLRYLEHGHLRLVFEASLERRLLLRLAPHLVQPLAFVWPVYQGARVPGWKLKAGLAMYDALAMFRNVQTYKGLNAQQVKTTEPRLNAQGLKGGARYWDAATDDARITLVNALSASEAGAVVANHVEVVALRHEDGKVKGARVRDTLTGRELSVSAKVVVNATGPWTDDLRRMDEGEGMAVVRGSKGVHLNVPRERVGNKEALTLLSPVDGRVYFVLPNGKFSMIGTTETPTSAHPDQVRATKADVQYLLDSVNSFFPEAKLTPADVVSAWAGIRPLIASAYRGEGDPNSASREHQVAVTPSGMVTITGGKLTTFRVMARDVVDAVERGLGLPHKRETTGEHRLPGGENISDVGDETAAALEALGGAGMEETADRLVFAYGSRWRTVMGLARERPELALPIVEDLPFLMAEAVYAVRYEFARTLADVLMRRTKVAFQTRDHGAAAAAELAPVIAPLLEWSDRDVDEQLARYAEDVRRTFAIDDAEPAVEANADHHVSSKPSAA